MPTGPVCDRTCPSRKPREDPAPTPYAMFSMLSSNVLKSGCHWRLLPHEFPPWSTVYYHFRRFRLKGLWHLILKLVHTAERKRVGRGSPPDSGHHGLPERQNRRRIGPPKRLRRPQERRRAQAPPSGGYFGSSALGLCHLGRRTR